MISFSNMGRYGRLGNQMFQYACAYAVAKRHNTEIGISSHDSYRQASTNQLIETFTLQSAVLDKFDNVKYSFQENGFEYDARIEIVPNDTDIQGYFQSERYFSHVRKDLLINEFSFRPHIQESANKVWDSYNHHGPVCSIHVRRGDYKTLQDTHPNLGLDYYARAIELIPECEKYIIFSDDTILAQELMSKIQTVPAHRFTYPDLDYNISIAIMSRCTHHIIANSSYSWWGAWLSQQHGIVAAPKTWFGIKGPSNWKDIYCNSWNIV